MKTITRANGQHILEAKNVMMHYPVYGGMFRKRAGVVKAVDNVDLLVRRGETLGLVGESGCGKTSLGRCLISLQTPTSGSIRFTDCDTRTVDLLQMDKAQSFEIRRKLQIVFQDPYSSLNPSKTVLEMFDEPMKIHGIKSASMRRETAEQLMISVNLQPEYLFRYPHEFSGGQRQRICIARALCVNPELIVLDEPVSALDVSIQAQVLNLLKDIQRERNLTYVFIAHDLSVVEYISDRIAVMYLGKIVELASADDLYLERLHPYTEALLSAIPIPERGKERNRIILTGDLPSPANPPSGCNFHPRCPKAMEICRVEEPNLLSISGKKEHFVACHLTRTESD